MASRGKGSKQKGSGYERRIAKILGEWWGEPFRRTPNSGGWDKQVDDGSVMATGDIIPPHGSAWPFSVECKNQEGWTLEAIMSGRCVRFLKWWEQCRKDARTVEKLPLLIFTRNRQPDFAAIYPASDSTPVADVRVPTVDVPITVNMSSGEISTPILRDTVTEMVHIIELQNLLAELDRGGFKQSIEAFSVNMEVVEKVRTESIARESGEKDD